MLHGIASNPSDFFLVDRYLGNPSLDGVLGGAKHVLLGLNRVSVEANRQPICHDFRNIINPPPGIAMAPQTPTSLMLNYFINRDCFPDVLGPMPNVFYGPAGLSVCLVDCPLYTRFRVR